MAEHVMVNPLQMKDNVGERWGRKRETQGLGGKHDQMEVCLDGKGFCAADNLNASNSS